MALWYFLWLFGIFLAFWYILWYIFGIFLVYFSRFGMFYQEKFGNPALKLARSFIL
jgi:hypothetical protein